MLVGSGCDGSKKSGSASSPSAPTSGSSSPASSADTAASNASEVKSAGEAVSGFVSNVRVGKGAAACAFLTDAEQKLFVKNAVELAPKLDTKSCASTVTSFNAANRTKLKYLDGTLTNVSVAGEFADGTWMWTAGNGQQAAVLERHGSQWLLGTNSNDFPTSVLHFFDQG